MNRCAPVVHATDVSLRADPSRLLARLYLPGEELSENPSRVGRVAARVLALPEAEIQTMAAALLGEFGPRHRGLAELLTVHAAAVASHLPAGCVLSEARALVMGATFTAEYAVEGAALCNPSAVLHPDQDGLGPGQARVAVSLRGIGEGHISAIEFATAVIGPGARWEFCPRQGSLVSGVLERATWSLDQLRGVLQDVRAVDDLAHHVLAQLPDHFTEVELELVIAAAPASLLSRPGAPATMDTLRRVVNSAYRRTLPVDAHLTQLVLLPTVPEESNGVEDARFVRFIHSDGQPEYRATYTAYDGSHIVPRTLTSPDLRAFTAHRLSGPAARNKGMAMFPRTIGGRYWALCRSDGESNGITRSADGFVWDPPQIFSAPIAPWEILQSGNCGPPIETSAGWLVLTHGVGPMRVYQIGAMLLDLTDPRRVIGKLVDPLIRPETPDNLGYVPNVVYSCGAVVHDGRLWIPYGIGDTRIGVAWVHLDELIAALVETSGR